jgi:hypothetical protein
MKRFLFPRRPHQEAGPVSSESSSPRSDGDSARDNGYRPSEVRQVTKEDGSVETWYRYLVEPDTPAIVFEHVKRDRLFILTWPDGRTERFRDNPVRHLVVEPDPQTGEMRPVIKPDSRLTSTSAAKSESCELWTNDRESASMGKYSETMRV